MRIFAARKQVTNKKENKTKAHIYSIFYTYFTYFCRFGQHAESNLNLSLSIYVSMNYKSTTFGTLRTALVVLFSFMSVIAVKR